MTATEKLIKFSASTLIRSNKIDNLVDPLEDPEIQVAIKMAMGEINSTAPITNLTMESMWANSSYQYLLTLGVSKYMLMVIVSNWVHDGIETTIDEFTIANRLSDYTALLDRFTVEFSEKLVITKPFLSRTSRSTMIKTPKIAPRGSNVSPTLTNMLPRTMYKVK